MEVSTQTPGSHAISSPSGRLLASIVNGKLRISPTNAPERFFELQIRIASKHVSAIRWQHDEARIAVTSSQLIEIVHIDEPTHRMRIDNGSGGLGNLASADFVGPDQLLVLWEFGKAKLWNLSTGLANELGDVKTTCTGRAWQPRPGGSEPTLRALATLSRPGADDLLSLHFPAESKSLSAVKVPSLDARSLSWSPDGRWLAILDSATANPGVHFYTPDGHRYRSYPAGDNVSSGGLEVKALTWSKSGQVVAISRYDGRIVLLNTRTFAPLAMIEHTTNIDQNLVPPDQQALLWREVVSASGDRTYNIQSQPFSPPLSRTKTTTEPSELGVAETCFSCDGNYLATRDERTLSTVWIWDMRTLSTKAVLIQHTNIRRMHWHPSRPETLMLDCGEGVAYLFSADSKEPPTPLRIDVQTPANLSWISTPQDATPIILAANKTTFCLCYPEGRPDGDGNSQALGNSQRQHQHANVEDESMFDEGESEDSLYGILSGRKPMPPRTEPSYTERIDFEVSNDETASSMQLDDTFVGRKANANGVARGQWNDAAFDPLDDSEFF